MNKREKQMLIITSAIVGLALLYWLIPRSGPANASANSSTENTSQELTVETSRAELKTLAISVENFASLVDSRAEITNKFLDVFRIRLSEEVENVVSTIDDNQLPSLGGIFLGEKNSAAMLDGIIRYVGDSHSGYELYSVSTLGVTLNYKNRRYFIDYDPTKKLTTDKEGAGGS